MKHRKRVKKSVLDYEVRKMTYHYETPDENSECHQCGKPATLLLVADYYDAEGYIDEIPLCENCVEERER